MLCPSTFSFRHLRIVSIVCLIWNYVAASSLEGATSEHIWVPNHLSPPFDTIKHPNRVLLSWFAGGENLITNGDFESSLTNGWKFEGEDQVNYIWDDGTESPANPLSPISGERSLLIRGILTNKPQHILTAYREGVFYQDVEIPSEATSAVLAASLFASYSIGEARVRMEVRDWSNRVLEVPFDLDRDALQGAEPKSLRINLSRFTGRQIRIAFVVSVTEWRTRIQLDDVRLLIGPIPGAEFHVHITQTAATRTNWTIKTRDIFVQLENLPTARYQWQVATVRNGQTNISRMWLFETAGRDPAHHLEFDRIPLPLHGKSNIPLRISSKAASGFMADNAPPAGRGAMHLILLSTEQRQPSLLITEVDIGATNAIEFLNVSTNTVDVSDWQIIVYGSVNSSVQFKKDLFRIPPGSLLGPGQIFTLSTGGDAPGTFPALKAGQNTLWTFNPVRGVGLFDAATNSIDFVNIQESNPTTFSHMPPAFDFDQWTGPAVGVSFRGTKTYQRNGAADHNDASDWVQAPPTLGEPNAGLRIPMGLSVGRVWSSPLVFTNAFNGIWTNLVSVAPGTNLFFVANNGKGLVGRSEIFNILEDPPIHVELPAIANEDKADGKYTGALVLQKAADEPIVVNLATLDPERLSIPEEIAIAQGTERVEFPFSVIDNQRIEGPKEVLVYGSTEGRAVIPAKLRLIDDETAGITIRIPQTIPEGQRAVGMVEVSPVLDYPLTVSLSTGDAAFLTVPRTVAIPAGESSISFHLSAPENKYITRDRMVEISGAVAGWPRGRAEIMVTDNEPRFLQVIAPESLAEGTNKLIVGGSVKLSGIPNEMTTILFSSDDSSEVSVPSSIVFPPGAGTNNFSLEVIDDEEKDGTQSVQLKASSDGFQDGMQVIKILDNDPFRFSVEVSSDPKFPGAPFTVQITPYDIDGMRIPNFRGRVRLAASAGDRLLSIQPEESGSLLYGNWLGTVAISELSDGVRVAADYKGARGESQPFRLFPNPIKGQINLAVQDMIWDRTRGKLIASVAETDLSYSNNIVIIDPRSGTVDRSFKTGPIRKTQWRDQLASGTMALSSDGKTVYVATRDETFIEQYDMNSGLLVRDFSVGLRSDGEPLRAIDLEVVPGREDLILVSRYHWLNEYTTALFDRGTRLPNTVASAPLLAGSDGTYVFHSSGVVSRSKIDANGLMGLEYPPASDQSIIGLGDVRLNRGSIYFASGAVFDPWNLKWIHGYPVAGPILADQKNGTIEFSQDGNYIWYISGIDANGGQVLELFHRQSHQAIRRVSLSMIPAQVARMWECGPELLALHNREAIFLLQSPLFLPVGTAIDLNLSRFNVSTAAVGQAYTYTLAVTNKGDSAATDVILDDVIPKGARFVSAMVSRGQWEDRTNSVRALFGDIPSGGGATFIVTLEPLHGGSLAHYSHVAAYERDENLDDNQVDALTPVHMPLEADSYGIIPLPTLGMTSHLKSNRIYSSLGANGGIWRNQVIEIDAITGQIVGSLDVGSNPESLEISHNGTHLYVASSDKRSIRRFDLSKRTMDLQLDFPQISNQEHLLLNDMCAVPERDQSIAVLLIRDRAGQIYAEGIAIYDGAVRRPVSATNSYASPLVFSFDGKNLYGLSSPTTPILLSFSVTDEGVQFTDTEYSFSSERTVASFCSDGKMLYTSAGVVINPESKSVTNLPITLTSPQGVLFHSLGNRVCLADRVNKSIVLHFIDTTTLQSSGSVRIEGVDDFISEFCPAGPERVAFRTQKGTIYLVRSSHLRTNESDADQDGMPDAWEMSHNLNPEMDDRTHDPDLDGISNAAEFVAGTDPRDAQSNTRLEAKWQELRGWELRLQGKKDRRYQLEQSLSIESDSWNSVGDAVSGSDQTIIWPTQEPGFYRVRIVR